MFNEGERTSMERYETRGLAAPSSKFGLTRNFQNLNKIRKSRLRIPLRLQRKSFRTNPIFAIRYFTLKALYWLV
jgi:hypothetical protein